MLRQHFVIWALCLDVTVRCARPLIDHHHDDKDKAAVGHTAHASMLLKPKTANRVGHVHAHAHSPSVSDGSTERPAQPNRGVFMHAGNKTLCPLCPELEKSSCDLCKNCVWEGVDVKGCIDAQTAPEKKQKYIDPGGLGANLFCFGQSTSWTLAASTPEGPWIPVRLSALSTGDFVPAAASPDGPIFVNRVWKNLHRENGEGLFEMLAIVHAEGTLVLSPSHVVFVNGIPQAAQHMVPGDVLNAPSDGSRSTWPRQLRVLQVRRVLDGIVNPVTHSGRILVSSGEFPSSRQGTGLLEPGLVLSTTVIDSPGNVLLIAAAMPRLSKVAALCAPRLLDSSAAAEDLALAAAGLSSVLPAPFFLVVVAILDTVATLAVAAGRILAERPALGVAFLAVAAASRAGRKVR